MRNFFVLSLTVALVAGLSACGSVQKNAQEKLENGEYASALEIFDRILKNDTGNLDAQEGRKRAREGVLAEKLIGVRKARDSGNPDAALDQLLEVTSLEATWNTFPPAAARFTQEEETNYAWKPYAARLEVMLKAKQPLRAETVWNRYAPIFTGPKHAVIQSAFGPTIARAGRSHCRDLSASASGRDPYYTGLVARYCRYWKAAGPRTATGKGRTKDLISGIVWDGKLEGLPAEYSPIVRSALEDGLRQSPWFDPEGGRKLPISLSGSYSFSHSKNLVSRVKEYSEDENYQVVEPVAKTRQVPYDAQETYTDPKDGFVRVRTVQRMRSESYTENETFTRTRSIKKQFPYSALFHQQNIEMNGSLATKVGTQDISASETDKASAEGDEQNIRDDHVGLKPIQPTLIDPATWVKSSAQKWRGLFAEKLRAEWISQVCHAPEAGAAAGDVAESVLKCRREPTAGNLPFVNDWYVRSFGMAQAEVEKMLPEK